MSIRVIRGFSVCFLFSNFSPALPLDVEEFNFQSMTAVEALWVPAKHLILGDDPQLRLFGEISVWRNKIELFRKGEDERMFLHDPTPEDLRVHRSLLQRLIADGNYLLSLARQVGVPQNDEGVTPGSLTATVEMLEADYRGWHEPMPSDRRERILHAAFPDVA